MRDFVKFIAAYFHDPDRSVAAHHLILATVLTAIWIGLLFPQQSTSSWLNVIAGVWAIRYTASAAYFLLRKSPSSDDSDKPKTEV